MIVLIDYDNTGNVVDLVDRKPINFIYHGRVLNFSDEISYNLELEKRWTRILDYFIATGDP